VNGSPRKAGNTSDEQQPSEPELEEEVIDDLAIGAGDGAEDVAGGRADVSTARGPYRTNTWSGFCQDC
jgi:hypothetical protein